MDGVEHRCVCHGNLGGEAGKGSGKEARLMRETCEMPFEGACKQRMT